LSILIPIPLKNNFKSTFDISQPQPVTKKLSGVSSELVGDLRYFLGLGDSLSLEYLRRYDLDLDLDLVLDSDLDFERVVDREREVDFDLDLKGDSLDLFGLLL